MEGIIFMVITLIVGTIVKSAKNKQQNQKPMPPFNNQPAQQNFEMPKQPNIRKSLEDFASEVFEQLNEKAQPKPSVNPVERNQEPIKTEKVEEKKSDSRRISTNPRQALDGNRSSKRTSTSAKSASTDIIKKDEIGNIVPTTRTALMQAIITTEILGPPKAKQR